jgi:hypothetical protein
MLLFCQIHIKNELQKDMLHYKKRLQ